MNSGIGIGSYMISAQQQFEMAKILAGKILIGTIAAPFAAFGLRLGLIGGRWRQAGSRT